LASFFFYVFMDLDSVSVHKHAKKELGQYAAILTSHLVNNPYLFAVSIADYQGKALFTQPFFTVVGNPFAVKCF